LRVWQIQALLREGRRIVWWNRDTKDFRASREQVQAVAGGAHARDIVLMHDRRSATVAALPHILRTLHCRGLRTITL
jgi:hypothetical protein